MRTSDAMPPLRQVDTSSWCSWLIFSFASPLVYDGYNKILTETDAFDMGGFDKTLLAQCSANKLNTLWDEEVLRAKAESREASLLTAAMSMIRADLTTSVLLSIGQVRNTSSAMTNTL